MKRFLKWLPFLAAAALVASCSKDEPAGVGGNDGGDKEYATEANALTAEGANIKLRTTDYTSFEWQVVPNSDCLSYRCDVYMYDRFMNDLWEQRKTRPELTEEEYVEERLFAQDGSGAGTWAGERDFSSQETIFQQSTMFPDTEYVVFVYGCLSDDGNNPSELTKLVVRTADPGPLVGNPRVQVDAVANQRATQAYITPNEDAAYFNLFTLPGQDVRDFLENFTEEQLCNVTSSFVGSPISSAECTYDADLGVTCYRDQVLNWGFNADPNHEIASIGVARDVNMKMYPVPTIKYYTVAPKNPDAPLPSYTYDPANTVLSAFAVKFRLEFNPETTANVYYSLQPNTSGVPKDAEDLIMNGGWVVGPGEYDQFQYVTSGVENYIFVSARNYQADILPMDTISFGVAPAIPKYGEPSNMADESLFSIEIPEDGVAKTQGRVVFKVGEGISNWYFAALTTGDHYTDPEGENWGDVTSSSNPENTAAYLFQKGNIFTNADGISEDDWGSFTFTGMEPSTSYTVMALAVTWDSKYVPVQYATFTTSDNTGGPNPNVEFDMDKTVVDATNMQWQVRFVPNEDVTQMYYMILDEVDACTTLPDGVNASMEEKAAAWTERLLSTEGGMSNIGNPATLGPTLIDDNMLAIAMAYGSTDSESGERYRSALKVLRLDYETLEMEDISDQLSSSAQAAIQKAVERMEAQKHEGKNARVATGRTASGVQHPALVIRAK